MRHEIKCWPKYFSRVFDGTKTFEIRDNDRGYQAGDTVLMREYDPEKADQPKEAYTGRAVTFTIGYISPEIYHPEFGAAVVFSIIDLNKHKYTEV